MKKEIICTVCPVGCRITVEGEGANVTSIVGHTCKRGETYALTECTAPKRVVTSTAPLKSGGVVPVKTNGSIPKELMFECAKLISETFVDDDATIGTVIIADVLGTGVDVVTTRNAKL